MEHLDRGQSEARSSPGDERRLPCDAHGSGVYRRGPAGPPVGGRRKVHPRRLAWAERAMPNWGGAEPSAYDRIKTPLNAPTFKLRGASRDRQGDRPDRKEWTGEQDGSQAEAGAASRSRSVLHMVRRSVRAEWHVPALWVAARREASTRAAPARDACAEAASHGQSETGHRDRVDRAAER